MNANGNEINDSDAEGTDAADDCRDHWRKRLRKIENVIDDAINDCPCPEGDCPGCVAMAMLSREILKGALELEGP